MDLIVYANVMVKQFPKHEKYQLAARIMGLCYDLLAPMHKTDIWDWRVRHA